MAHTAPHRFHSPGSRGLFRSRLSQRIALAVFSGIVAIEAVILVPSIVRREQELLGRLQKTSAAHLKGVLIASGVPNETPVNALSPQTILEKIELVQSLEEVKGGSVYRADGELVGTFGEAPGLTFDATMEASQKLSKQHRRAQRYDARWPMSPLDGKYVLIIRYATDSVAKEVWAFIGRIAGLVLIISGVVTLATMVVLKSLLIEPILALRRDLLSAAPAALQEAGTVPTFASQESADRQDELGEVILAFQEMYQRISQSIAQRRKAEQRLRESESRFRTVVNQASESILVIDRTSQIRDANQFALNYLGYSSEELLGRSILEINPTFDRDRFDEHWQALQKGDPITFETSHRNKDGHVYPVEVRSGLIFMDGEDQILSLTRDITVRKEAEKAQIRLAEIGELAAMIVHEVRNPLATVFMALTGLKRMELPKSGQLRLELALEESERLQRLLNEILSYSREQRLEGIPVELNALTQELCETLQKLPQAENRDIKLQGTNDHVLVKGDRDKLKQVFINLVTNACEAIPPGERVTWLLETSPTRSMVSALASASPSSAHSSSAHSSSAHSSTDAPVTDKPVTDAPVTDKPVTSNSVTNEQVTIRVHNGGDPIPPDVLPKLTKPFVSTKASGNGLGLAITKRIVEAHGGSLMIASTADAGTTVTVILPLASPT